MTASRTPTRIHPKPALSYTRYSEAEYAFVNEWAGIISYGLLAEIMHRSGNSVAIMAGKLGLTNGANIPDFVGRQRRILTEMKRQLDQQEQERQEAA